MRTPSVKRITEARAPFCFPWLRSSAKRLPRLKLESAAGHAEGQTVTVTKDTIQRWRMAADERRAAAAKMADPQARLGMLNAARCYDDLADSAEAQRDSAADERSDAD